MSTRSSIFYAATDKFEAIHIYHEGTNGEFRIELEQNTQDGYSSINVAITLALKDAFIAEIQRLRDGGL